VPNTLAATTLRYSRLISCGEAISISSLADRALPRASF
jgi:hypothetical protein